MIYHHTQSDNIFETYLNLEELVCLSRMTGILCKLKASDFVKESFNLAEFDLVEEIPESAIKCDLSDYVCMYDKDLNDMYGSEFLSYRKDHQATLFRLDKLDNQDLNVTFSRYNFYESKYFVSDRERYTSAILSSSNFHLNLNFLKKYDSIETTFQQWPLFCFTDNMDKLMKKSFDFPFQNCYYTADDNIKVGKFMEKHNLNGYNINSILARFNKQLHSDELYLVLISIAHRFTDLYGSTNDQLFGILAKQFYKKDITPRLMDLQLDIINPTANFDFSRYNFDLPRSEIVSLMRLSDCVNNSV